MANLRVLRRKWRCVQQKTKTPLNKGLTGPPSLETFPTVILSGSVGSVHNLNNDD